MKVRIDPDICQGHTLCAMTAPEIFTLREIDGHGQVLDENVPPEWETLAKDAVRGCPEQAISLF